uniref:uncharacterized protein LOC131124834 n=1 Tax=Doryrhamphus excisus TaxID=161450 RepID=UPI0025ADAE77|nr:uncharacterized protein LOC131124834 [Doryrhamphus excisus]
MSSVQRPSRNADWARPQRFSAGPRRPFSTWPSETRGTPVFVSFVRKAVLWEKEVSCHTTRVNPKRPPTLCPRFLSHMKAHCQGLRPPCVLSSRPRPQPTCEGRKLTAVPPRAPPGHVGVGVDRRASVPSEGSHRFLPRIRASPSSATIHPPSHKTSLLRSSTAGPPRKAENVHSSPTRSGIPVCVPEVEEPAGVSSTEAGEPHWEFQLSPAGRTSSKASLGSLWDFSQPSSSLFSRSTDLASGRTSVLSEHRRLLDPLDSYSNHGLSSGPPGSTPQDHQLEEPSDLLTALNTHEDHAPERLRSDGIPPLHRPPTPRASPSVPNGHPESRPRPVLPPISPLKGRRDSSALLDSAELSCGSSAALEELDAIAPTSASCSSLERASDWSGGARPGREPLSPGLAALTVGCDSGNLGSLSRVQLLLLDRPTSLTEDFLPDEEHPGDVSVTWPGPAGPLTARPLTADRPPERCDSSAKVPSDHQSDWSIGGSRSPSSWTLQHPSEDSDIGSDGGSDVPGCRNPNEKDRRLEERKSKVLKMLYKLQDDSGRRGGDANICSDFDNFDFLAKFCIFGPDKLEEYKKAFEAEDADQDGYISCIQVVDALKSIVPAELLSDQEEIYVYRILALVDFRVTDGLVDLRLFAVIASLAQKIAAMDDFMRSLVTTMDFRSLEVRLFKVKQLFLFLLEEQRGGGGSLRGFISTEQLLLELKAGGIHLDQEATIAQKLQNLPPLDLLDFLAYLPLFMLIHKSVVANPLHDSGPV